MSEVVITPGMQAGRQLAAMPLEARIADVCPGCGLHIIIDPAERLTAIAEGRSCECPRCHITKDLSKAAQPDD